MLAMSKYHMKKKEREITNLDEIKVILSHGKYTTLAMCRNNEPYVITMSYGYDKEQNALYFHSALEGLKFEFLNENNHVCGTVIEDKGYKMNECSHSYRSAVYWGEMKVIEDLNEKKVGFEILLDHLEENPDAMRRRFLNSMNVYSATSIMKLDIIEMTGKASP